MEYKLTEDDFYEAQDALERRIRKAFYDVMGLFNDKQEKWEYVDWYLNHQIDWKDYIKNMMEIEWEK